MYLCGVFFLEPVVVPTFTPNYIDAIVAHLPKLLLDQPFPSFHPDILTPSLLIPVPSFNRKRCFPLEGHMSGVHQSEAGHRIDVPVGIF